MLTSCWSAKGGVGTTVVATCLALLLGARHPGGAVIVDMCGGVPNVLGLEQATSPGLTDWLSAGDAVPADALDQLLVPVTTGVVLLPRGVGDLVGSRAPVLAALLDQSPRHIVADCGLARDKAGAAVVGGSNRSLLVTRSCYLALQQAADSGRRPSGVVVVREPGRPLKRNDVEQLLDAPIVAEIEYEPVVARAVDAGLLTRSRLPRLFARSLRHAL